MENSLSRVKAGITIHQQPNLEEVKLACNGMTNLKSDLLFTHTIPYDDSSLEKYCLDPFEYIVSAPGKNVRENLVDTLNHWLKVPEDVVPIIKDIVYIMHNFSLLMDDIQDGSLLRRSIPCAHHIFGTSEVVLHTNIAWISCMLKACSLPHPQALTVFLESAQELVRGQTLEMHWRDNSICPTPKEYMRMCLQSINNKYLYYRTDTILAFVETGSIFMFACNMLQLFSTARLNTENLIVLLGLYFQINDDYQNLTNTMFYNSKGFCEDISEGKFGYPVVHAASQNPKIGAKLREILSQKTTDVELKKQCLFLIKQCGSFQHTKELLTEIKSSIYNEVNSLGPNEKFEFFFDVIIRSSL